MNISKLDWLENNVIYTAQGQHQPARTQIKWESPSVVALNSANVQLFTWHLILIKNNTEQMSFALKVNDFVKVSSLKASCKINMFNAQNTLIKSLETVNLDFLNSENGVEKPIHQNFIPYHSLSAFHVDASFGVKIECVMEFTSKFEDKRNFILQDKLAPWIQDTRFADVEFEVGGKIIKAHKILLIAHSPVFEAMFEHTMSETKEGVVKVTDVTYEVLQEVIRYIYTEEIPKLGELAFELLAAANKYQLDDLKNRCQNMLVDMLEIDNAIHTLIFADTYNAPDLKNIALKFIQQNLKEIILQDSYKTLERDLLFQIIVTIADNEKKLPPNCP